MEILKYRKDVNSPWQDIVALVGPQGPKGDKGDQGIQGPKGYKGDKGDPFTYNDFTEAQLASLKGPKGDTGSKGERGEKGEKGDKGETGSIGPKGEKGDTGATGAVGPKGDTGATGATGPKGDKGEPGRDGANGKDGVDGKDGITEVTELPIASADIENGIYRCGNKYYICKGREADWENIPLGANLQNTEIKIGNTVGDGLASQASRRAFIVAWLNGDYTGGISGSLSLTSYSDERIQVRIGSAGSEAHPGDTFTITEPYIVANIYAYDVNYSQIFYKPISGITYEWIEVFVGEAAQVSVGTVSIGEPGTNAIVTNSGTPSAAVLNFTIPKGEPGENGQDYVLTDADKQEIAQLVLAALPAAEEVSF